MDGMTLGVQCYLLLQVVDLRAQPLHHAVQLRDLHLGGAEVVPVLTGGPLQLLVLGGCGEGEEKQEARMVRSEKRRQWLPRARQALIALLGGAFLFPHHFPSNPSLLSLGSASYSRCPQASPHSWTFLLGSRLLSLSLDTRLLILTNLASYRVPVTL